MQRARPSRGAVGPSRGWFCVARVGWIWWGSSQLRAYWGHETHEDYGLDLRVEEEPETEPGEHGAEDGPKEGVRDVALGGRLVHV
jgi:hypothetical protein